VAGGEDLHLVARLRCRGAVLPRPQQLFAMWCLFMYKCNVNFVFLSRIVVFNPKVREDMLGVRKI
jgi:hypothetical protein